MPDSSTLHFIENVSEHLLGHRVFSSHRTPSAIVEVPPSSNNYIDVSQGPQWEHRINKR